MRRSHIDEHKQLAVTTANNEAEKTLEDTGCHREWAESWHRTYRKVLSEIEPEDTIKL
jgi:hypothetical protein